MSPFIYPSLLCCYYTGFFISPAKFKSKQIWCLKRNKDATVTFRHCQQCRNRKIFFPFLPFPLCFFPTTTIFFPFNSFFNNRTVDYYYHNILGKNKTTNIDVSRLTDYHYNQHEFILLVSI